MSAPDQAAVVPFRPTSIFLGSGEIKAATYLGLLSSVDISKTTVYGGTGFGAFISLMLVIGCGPWSIALMLENFCNSLERTKNGLISLCSLEEKITELATRKFASIPTFESIYQETHKDLVIAIADIGVCQVTHYCRGIEPDMNVVKAVVASMYNPMHFEDDRMVRGRWGTHTDASLLDPLPYSYIDDGSGDMLVAMVAREGGARLMSKPMGQLTLLRNEIIKAKKENARISVKIVIMRTDSALLYTLDRGALGEFLARGLEESLLIQH